jgi:aromatic ring hydroxylase
MASARRSIRRCLARASRGYTHPFFRAPTSAEDLVRGRDAIVGWTVPDLIGNEDVRIVGKRKQ